MQEFQFVVDFGQENFNSSFLFLPCQLSFLLTSSAFTQHTIYPKKKIGSIERETVKTSPEIHCDEAQNESI